MSSDKKESKMEASSTTAGEEPVAEAIEEDDEFEEFEPCRWDAHDEDAEDVQQWQDNWDDDDIEDDFTKQLREELSNSSSAAAKS
mmetsp:Transcript_13543/g.18579  ORF Transcript_13543/g.18579 Transcript_13543/m.18579 type:complete len:85 (-) Transcript_13543:477-731(-)|eukprot:CAMPEP_0185724652 /NCGR_PEP_ID=MMETSP1171-20130828/1068_1 /TAXON_ID=374046 /ORGANISM="Helicotheca tamensis, Strain CCMP826" /LENGTH=84 /DNA_ID=CAMNT_0028392547 /DNA_START=106 /DNA_END=360 /DNA_ORIENTATION=-